MVPPGPDGGQGLVEAGAVAVGAGEAVVEVDPVGVDAELEQRLVLGGDGPVAPAPRR